MSWIDECRMMVVSASEPMRRALATALDAEGCHADAFGPSDPRALAHIHEVRPEVLFIGPAGPEVMDFLARLEQAEPEHRPHVALVEDAPAGTHPTALRAFVRDWISAPPDHSDRPSTTAIPFPTER